MSETNSEKDLIPYKLISRAIRGDQFAIQGVLNFYQKYISKLCLRPLIDDNGKERLIVDTYMYRRLESKLIEKIIEYQLDY